MKLSLLFFFLLGALLQLKEAEEIEKISLPSGPDLQRADIYALKVTPELTAALVLSSGFNGNRQSWIQDPKWQACARDNNLEWQWVDIDLKTKEEQGALNNQPSLTGWLPDPKLLSKWEAVHQP